MADPLGRLKQALADRYAIEREIGSGGMAAVHLADDLKHHRKVRVKVVRSELADTLGADRQLHERRSNTTRTVAAWRLDGVGFSGVEPKADWRVSKMSKRTGDLRWVTPPKLVGVMVVVISIAVAGLAILFAFSGGILEAVLVVASGIFLMCVAILDLLGELVGGIRDLSGRMGGSTTRQSDESG